MTPTEQAVAFLSDWPGLIEDVFVAGDPSWPSPLVVLRLATGRTVKEAGAEATLLCHTAGLHAGVPLDFCVVEFQAFATPLAPAECIDRRTQWKQVNGRLEPLPLLLGPGILADAVSRIHIFP